MGSYGVDLESVMQVVKMLTGEEDVLQITANFHKRYALANGDSMDAFNEQLLDTPSSSSDGS